MNQLITQFRSLMVKKNIDAYYIPTSDFHESEYVGEYFKVRKFLSGFTGSAGTLVITKDIAALWTDGRYFIQAENELKDSGIELMRMGEEKVPKISEFLEKQIPEHGILGFDGQVVNTKTAKELQHILHTKNISFYTNEDLAGQIWQERPPLSKEPVFLLDICYSGKSTEDKLKELRAIMEEKKADYHILTTLDDIAWLFNIRGNDILHNPVVLSYAVITMTEATLYLQKETVKKEIISSLKACGVTIAAYEQIYEDVKNLAPYTYVLLNTAKVNYSLTKDLPKSVTIIDEINPTTKLKAIKNETELSNLRNAHIKDGVAVTKFMYWLKTNIGKTKITECSASDYLEEMRKKQEGFIELSFTTIAGYKEHAAMMHYSASKETDYELAEEGFLLVDSGGQYFEGTTDITRTFALGKLTDELKLHFTTVLSGMLNLSNTKFLYGCRGINLDILARNPLWKLSLDYKCGTGHGVGYLLNVHEAPNGFRWKHVPERDDSCILEEGMVTTNEPGIYVEGSHGIRIEDELVCKKADKNEYGQFMEFETITYAPIDLDAVEPSLLGTSQKQVLNQYHAIVFEKLSPYLEEKEREWLKHYTRAI